MRKKEPYGQSARDRKGRHMQAVLCVSWRKGGKGGWGQMAEQTFLQGKENHHGSMAGFCFFALKRQFWWQDVSDIRVQRL